MSRPLSLTDVITLTAVQSLADAKTFARGLAYFHEGAVSRLQETERTVSASVRGTYQYAVELGLGHDGGLAYRCNCPVGDDAIFCKHAVAVALSWLENAGEEVFHVGDTEPVKPRKKRKTHMEYVREYVTTLPADALRDLLLEAAERDAGLRKRLLLAARASNGSDLSSMKAVVRQAARISRPLDWREADDYSDGLMSLVGVLRHHLAGPNAAQVVELAELAIAEAERSLEQIDDSSGNVMPAISELVSVHHEACLLTHPEPVSLAERLFRLQTEGTWDTFRDALPAYEEPLGQDGLQRYRELAQAAWAQLPALEFSRSRGFGSWDASRMRLEHAMLTLAELDGDVDALIRIASKNLSNSYQYLRVAGLCAEHGRNDEALDWAQQGIEACGKDVDERLLTFCIAEYQRRGDVDKVEALAWQRFTIRPTAEAFTDLMQVAKSVQRHQAIRERALAHLRVLIGKEEAPTGRARHPVWYEAMRGVLVQVLLAEQDDEQAWNAFNGGPVPQQLWAPMARARGKTHPHDAIALYGRLLPILIEAGRSGSSYEEAFKVVKAIGQLRGQLGEQATFAAELEAIRAEHRAKRNFTKLLAAL